MKAGGQDLWGQRAAPGPGGLLVLYSGAGGGDGEGGGQEVSEDARAAGGPATVTWGLSPSRKSLGLGHLGVSWGSGALCPPQASPPPHRPWVIRTFYFICIPFHLCFPHAMEGTVALGLLGLREVESLCFWKGGYGVRRPVSHEDVGALVDARVLQGRGLHPFAMCFPSP